MGTGIAGSRWWTRGLTGAVGAVGAYGGCRGCRGCTVHGGRRKRGWGRRWQNSVVRVMLRDKASGKRESLQKQLGGKDRQQNRGHREVLMYLWDLNGRLQ